MTQKKTDLSRTLYNDEKGYGRMFMKTNIIN